MDQRLIRSEFLVEIAIAPEHIQNEWHVETEMDHAHILSVYGAEITTRVICAQNAFCVVSNTHDLN